MIGIASRHANGSLPAGDMMLILRKLILICAAWLWFAASPGMAEVADSQSLLFDAPYLEQLVPPRTLSYSYRRKTRNEKVFGRSFEDTIRVRVTKSDSQDGLNTVSLEVFTGERQRRLGPHADMRGNPVLMVFLELDLWHMKRRVGGAPVYFRNTIRKAFRDSASIERIAIDFSGRNVLAHKVTIRPFAEDQITPRLKEFRAKTYEFTVSDAVPGGIYRIRTWVPEPDGGGPLIEDMMVIAGVDETEQR